MNLFANSIEQVIKNSKEDKKTCIVIYYSGLAFMESANVVVNSVDCCNFPIEHFIKIFAKQKDSYVLGILNSHSNKNQSSSGGIPRELDLLNKKAKL